MPPLNPTPNADSLSHWRRLHYIARVVVSSFVCIHLLNHLIVLSGPAAHIAFMDHVRHVYRHPAIELLLLGAVASQIITGLRLVTDGWRSHTGWKRLQALSGLYLAGFFLIHLSAVLTGRYVLLIDTNLYFGAAGLNQFPHLLFFVPYYGVSIVAFFGHIAALHYQKMERDVARLSPHRQAQGLLLGVLVMIATLYGLTGGFGGLPIPARYRVMTP